MDIAKIINSVADKYRPNDDEFKKILHAIALAESDGNPYAVGDNGNSIGLFQNNMAGGRGAGYTAQQLVDPTFNTELAVKELIQYYLQGVNQGLKGANLVAYVSRYGQRPAPGNEQHAARNYGRMVGNEEAVSTNEPHMQENQYQRALGAQDDASTIMDFIVPKAYAGGGPSTEAAAPGSLPPVKRSYTKDYMVKPEDTLWDIAESSLGSGARWKELQGYKGDPRQLPIGTKLTMPSQQQQAAPPQQQYVPPPTTPAAKAISQAAPIMSALQRPPTAPPVPKGFPQLPTLQAPPKPKKALPKATKQTTPGLVARVMNLLGF